MDNREIIKLFEKRRTELAAMYSGNSQQYVNLSKRHQIYGAISELDLVLEVLKFSKNAKEENSPAQEIASTTKENAKNPLEDEETISSLIKKKSVRKENKAERIKTKFMQFIDENL